MCCALCAVCCVLCAVTPRVPHVWYAVLRQFALRATELAAAVERCVPETYTDDSWTAPVGNVVVAPRPRARATALSRSRSVEAMEAFAVPPYRPSSPDTDYNSASDDDGGSSSDGNANGDAAGGGGGAAASAAASGPLGSPSKRRRCARTFASPCRHSSQHLVSVMHATRTLQAAWPREKRAWRIAPGGGPGTSGSHRGA